MPELANFQAFAIITTSALSDAVGAAELPVELAMVCCKFFVVMLFLGSWIALITLFAVSELPIMSSQITEMSDTSDFTFLA